MTENQKQQMEAIREQIQKMNIDKAILRYLITNAEWVHSTAVQDRLGCKYIYVKPGMYDYDVSNIDFVQTVYAENGIEVKKTYISSG